MNVLKITTKDTNTDIITVTIIIIPPQLEKISYSNENLCIISNNGVLCYIETSYRDSENDLIDLRYNGGDKIISIALIKDSVALHPPLLPDTPDQAREYFEKISETIIK